MHHLRTSRFRNPSILGFSAIAFLFLAGNEARCAANTNTQPIHGPRPASVCSAPASIAAHKTIVEAEGLEKRNHSAQAVHVILQTASSIDMHCRIRAALEVAAAAMEFRAGALTEAEQLGTKALSELYRFEDASEEIGVAEYIRGAVFAASDKPVDAEREYLNAASAFKSLGDGCAGRLAHVYTDLASINIRANKLRDAEAYLRKATDSEKLLRGTDRLERLARLDALIHLNYKEGKYSEAIRLNIRLEQLYGTDPDLPAGLRAHIYADLGGVLYSAGHYEQALLDLNKAVDLYKSEARNPKELGVTLAIVGRIELRLQDIAGARRSLEQAMKHCQDIRASYPGEAAFIVKTYGDYLARNRQWSMARSQYLDSMNLVKSDPLQKQEFSACLLAAAVADDHLHQKKESKTFRKHALAITAQLRTPGMGTTVDLATLAGPYSSTH